MLIILNLFINLLFITFGSSNAALKSKQVERLNYQYDIEKWLNDVDADLFQLNTLAAHITWNSSTDPSEKIKQQAIMLAQVRNTWKNSICESVIQKDFVTKEQKRKIYLLCRGPKFTNNLVLEHLNILGEMSREYNTEVCLEDKFGLIDRNVSNFPKVGDCLYGEPDLERLLKRTDLSSNQLAWIWLNWHDSVGVRIKEMYKISVNIQNQAARNNGYHDIGETWREELEIPDLEKLVFELYNELQPIYIQLHAVIRHKLYLKYGPLVIDPRGPIPEHVLGNMWGQDWSPLIDLFTLTKTKIDLNSRLQNKHSTVKDMVLEAEDFYTSMSLPKMTQQFWKYSILEENQDTTLCHGTAANLYSKNDYRILMCGKTTMDDFYVIHHELGHIEYYMAASEQPAIFRDGTNTAFHESIGDAVMHGVMTPQHLQRLSLITDEELTDKNTELFLLFLQALSKIPEIPFSLVVDKYRWDIFRGGIATEDWNTYYWNLNKKYRGIVPPVPRESTKFDAGAKFHIPDNTPYIRYFLSSIIQMQIFKSMCELSMYGSNANDNNQYLPLHRCDIYGSKNAGKKLLEMMEKGGSIHWSEALNIISNTKQISTAPFLEYYRPVYEWLNKYIKENNVFVGW